MSSHDKYTVETVTGVRPWSFEGDLDPARQRGQPGGWRRAGLPWIQS